MDPSVSQLALDIGMLRTPVQRVLGIAEAEAQSWEVQSLGTPKHAATAGVYRVRGTANTSGGSVPWSLVVKVCRDPGQVGYLDPRSPHYWKREFLAYSSGLLANLPPGVRAPRCYGAEECSDGRALLWLEDLHDAYDGRWPWERYVLAARHAGQFNGAYLVDRPLPNVPWLSVGTAMLYFYMFGPGLERVRAFADHPLARREWPDVDLLDRSIRIWREREVFSPALDRLPQTLCHTDFFRHNLFAVRSADNVDETVAIDWSYLGTAAVGEELMTLVWGSTNTGEYVDEARDLGESCFESYLAGLRDVGWRGDPRLVRLGYTLHALAFSGALSPRMIDNPEFLARWERNLGPIDDYLDRCARVRRYTIDLADEARDLIARLW